MPYRYTSGPGDAAGKPNAPDIVARFPNLAPNGIIAAEFYEDPPPAYTSVYAALVALVAPLGFAVSDGELQELLKGNAGMSFLDEVHAADPSVTSLPQLMGMLTGAPGHDGAKGATGATGAAGANGTNGAGGAKGADGAKGEKGDPGPGLVSSGTATVPSGLVANLPTVVDVTLDRTMPSTDYLVIAQARTATGVGTVSAEAVALTTTKARASIRNITLANLGSPVTITVFAFARVAGGTA